MNKVYKYNGVTGAFEKTYNDLKDAINDGYKNVHRNIKFAWKEKGKYFSYQKMDNYFNKDVAVKTESTINLNDLEAVLDKLLEKKLEGLKSTQNASVKHIDIPVVKQVQIKNDFEYIKDVKSKNGNVLAFSCIHRPFMHPKAVKFLKQVYDYYKCENIVELGDGFDFASISSHTPDPNQISRTQEYVDAKNQYADFAKVFPEGIFCLGNHDLRAAKMASRINVPDFAMRSLREMFDMPEGWKTCFKATIDGVLFTHGEGSAGTFHAANLAQKTGKSTVAGHAHCSFGVNAFKSDDILIQSANTGCLIDEQAMAFYYGKTNARTPILGCTVITDYSRNFIPILM